MTADVFLFPQHRRRGYARHIVETGQRQATKPMRRAYWRARKHGLARMLRRAGFDELQAGNAVDDLVFIVRVQAELVKRQIEADAKAEADAPRQRRAALRKARFARRGDVALWRAPVARDEGFRLRRWRRLGPPPVGSFQRFQKKPRVGRSAVFERFPRFRVHCSASQSAKG